MVKMKDLFGLKSVVLVLLFLLSFSSGYVLTTSKATKFLLDFKRDFDLNFGFQLRKMGIVQSIKRSKFFVLFPYRSW